MKWFDNTVAFWPSQNKAESEIVYIDDVPNGQIVESQLSMCDGVAENYSYEDIGMPSSEESDTVNFHNAA